jgi:hypothetical protein
MQSLWQRSAILRGCARAARSPLRPRLCTLTCFGTSSEFIRTSAQLLIPFSKTPAKC